MAPAPLPYRRKSEGAMKKNSVVHFEIYADDPEKAAGFYSTLFDWSIEPVPHMEYRLVKTVETDEKGMPTQTGGINGGIIKRPAGYNDRGWVNYINVDSVDRAVERAQQLGASVMKGKSPVPGMGWFAMLTDPQGTPFAVWQSDASAK
jgi:predicted enzyme related to lactoylglutathione lyase